ncbi:hypothetical protein RvVAR0630_18960 [Agrobacterium vitis]|nr:hypothetical protein RvVAR0630_18960 [Agrobacterium vitis]
MRDRFQMFVLIGNFGSIKRQRNGFTHMLRRLLSNGRCRLNRCGLCRTGRLMRGRTSNGGCHGLRRPLLCHRWRGLSLQLGKIEFDIFQIEIKIATERISLLLGERCFVLELGLMVIALMVRALMVKAWGRRLRFESRLLHRIGRSRDGLSFHLFIARQGLEKARNLPRWRGKRRTCENRMSSRLEKRRFAALGENILRSSCRC